MKTIIVFIFFAVLLVGCVTPMPNQTQIDAAYIGDKPTNSVEIIQTYLHNTLKDPDSAKCEFSDPIKGCVRGAPISGGHLYWGWLTEVKINAKNGFGAYTGYENWTFLLSNRSVMGVKDGSGFWVLYQ